MFLIALVAGIGLTIRYGLVTSPDEAATNAAPRISDGAFEHSASAICSTYVKVFDTETTLGDTPTKEEAGAFLSSIAGSFDTMVIALRDLPVAAPDRTAVETWLSDWEKYDAYGHQYAAAVKAGAERDLVAHDKTSVDALLRTRNGFAHANHMSPCAFH